MIIEYILVGVIAFSIGYGNGKNDKCNHKEHYVVVHKHKHKHKKHKFRFGKKLKRKHYHRNGTINMMCTNGWRW